MFLFSIIIPTYNRTEKLIQVLNFLINQSFKNFEVIVVEDVQNNQSQILEFKNQLNFKYIHINYKKTVSFKRNFGATKAIGKYLIFLDDDDYVSNNWLQDFANELIITENDIAFCGVICESNDKTNLIFADSAYQDERGWGIFLAGAFTIKKVIFDEVGGYDEILRYGENTELGLRLKEAIKTKSFLNKPNLIYKSSVDGGSKNITNTFIANNHILNKHHDWFKKNPNLHFNYLSVLGVISIKLNKISLAKNYFKLALTIKKNNYKAWLRYTIIQVPFIAKKIWRLN